MLLPNARNMSMRVQSCRGRKYPRKRARHDHKILACIDFYKRGYGGRVAFGDVVGIFKRTVRGAIIQNPGANIISL